MPMLSQATKTKQNKSKQKNSKMPCVKRNAESQPVWFEADNLCLTSALHPDYKKKNVPKARNLVGASKKLVSISNV